MREGTSDSRDSKTRPTPANGHIALLAARRLIGVARVLWGLLRTARFQYWPFGVLAAWIGGRLTGISSSGLFPLVASVLVALYAGSMLFNDWHDRPADRINQPLRPVASGEVGPDLALYGGGGAFAVAAVLALMASWVFGAVTAGLALASVLYTLHWKGIPFLGNAVVAGVQTSPLWLWLLFDSPVNPVLLVLASACFVGTLALEVAKTGEDLDGDFASGLHTAATTWGRAGAARIAAGLFCLGLLPCWSLTAKSSPSLLFVGLVGLSQASAVLFLVYSFSTRATARTCGKLVLGMRGVLLLMMVASFGVSGQ